MMIDMNIYVATLLGLLFVVVYSAFCTFIFNLNYRRMNNGKNLNIQQIMVNMLLQGGFALILMIIIIYLSYFN